MFIPHVTNLISIQSSSVDGHMFDLERDGLRQVVPCSCGPWLVVPLPGNMKG